MGDEIQLTEIEVIQGGVFQIDFKNMNTGQCYRVFSDNLFELLDNAMAKARNDWLEKSAIIETGKGE